MSGGEAVKQLSVAVAVFCVLLGAIYAARPEIPAIRRQYPFSGLIRELGDIEENKVRHLSAVSNPNIYPSRQAREQSIEGDEE
jgi:NADH dehydrogenase (ubiquinone) 1 beta subcomplex subunit 8